MRTRKFGWAGTLIVLAGVLWQVGSPTSHWISPSIATSAVDRSNVFYRLTSKYQYDDEIIDFDIVVGCGVRVTRYGDGDRSYDATRDPVIFAKGARDGSAIAQIVSSACLGETTANGRVPDDFMPGAIWFERKDDFSFGIAYVTEDAFQNSKSRLKFLGAKITKATRAEWEAYQPIAKQNLIDPKPFTWFDRPVSEDEVRANLWNMDKIKHWRRNISCHLVAKYVLTDPGARAIVSEYWPSDRPRFWTLPVEKFSELSKRAELLSKAEINGRPMSAFASYGAYQANGFATRAGGGVLYSGHKSYDRVPPIIYPLRGDDGIPWITPNLATTSIIYRDVDMGGDTDQGLAYCYATLRSIDSISKMHVPDYFERQFLTRVGGEPIRGEANDTRLAPDRPYLFFERDRSFYLQMTFGLS